MKRESHSTPPREPSTAELEHWIDAEAVQSLSGLYVRARTVADGVLAGLHRSKRHGRSVEFAEHKVYTPGDDTRHIDWKAFAKFDRFYVRRFLEETNLRAYMLVDLSGSMAYRGGSAGSLRGVAKADYARTLAATLMYLLIRQADAVGCMTFADRSGPHTAMRGGERQLKEVLAVLENAAPGGRTDPLAALAALESVISARTLLVVFSDLLDQGAQILGPLKALRNRGADVALMHVLHPDELRFPFDGMVRLLDLEGDRETQVDAASLRQAYQAEVESWRAGMQAQAEHGGISYQLCPTDEPPARALLRFVAPREAAA